MTTNYFACEPVDKLVDNRETGSEVHRKKNDSEGIKEPRPDKITNKLVKHFGKEFLDEQREKCINIGIGVGYNKAIEEIEKLIDDYDNFTIEGITIKALKTKLAEMKK